MMGCAFLSAGKNKNRLINEQPVSQIMIKWFDKNI